MSKRKEKYKEAQPSNYKISHMDDKYSLGNIVNNVILNGDSNYT